MITAFTVKNFKAIGDDPVRIELKPITLLFGANSAGKSSIIHALNYAHEVFNNHNLDDFKSLVHGNDLSRSITLSFELDFCVDMISSSTITINFPDKLTIDKIEEIKTDDDRVKLLLDYKKLLNSADKACVNIEISWNSIKQHPYVSRYEIIINQEKMVVILANINDKQYIEDGNEKMGGFISYFNTEHPIFVDLYKSEKIKMSSLLYDYIHHCSYHKNFKSDISGSNVKFDLAQKDALPNVDWKGLNFVENMLWAKSTLDSTTLLNYPDGRSIFAPPEIQQNLIISSHISRLFSSSFEGLLDILITKPGKRVAGWLESTCSIGPLREIPPEKFEYKPELSHQRWATGLAAWDKLYYIGQDELNTLEIRKGGGNVFSRLEEPISTLNIINAWLSDKELLNTGYKVFIEYYRDISLKSTHPLIVKLNAREQIDNVDELATEILSIPEKIRIFLHDKSRNINIAPHEVGTGISQVLPVVVAAVSLGHRLISIEQPELHIHPAMQVQLGDLFITQTEMRHNRFLIETHSEHLLLRILRRIRETNEGKSKVLSVPIDPGWCDIEYEEKKLNIKAEEVAIYYVESENGNVQVNRISLDENGRFIDRWPRGFFEEREKEYFGEQEDLSDELVRLFGK